MDMLKSLLGTVRRQPLGLPDGWHAEEADGSIDGEKTSIPHDLATLGFKNAKFLVDAIAELSSGKPLDDKKLLLEDGVEMLQKMPLNSGLSQTLSDLFVSVLWQDLPHPPPTVCGDTARYRRHDGGGNCPWEPELGKAGSAYARNVPPLRPKGPNLPDVEDVYEAFLKREGPFRPHPSGLNRLFFSFATVVIHELFQTSSENRWINETSSYVDLSTLYGNNEEEQKRVRTYENGLIYPDSIASQRIMMMPPGVGAVLLLFSRNHNHIAKNLFTVNEEGKYKQWSELDDKKKKEQDEDIFQITRNINVGFFASVVLHDYVAAILNTPRANSEWSLDLGKEIKKLSQRRVERGSGNLVSAEFAVLYHWHAALSAADDQWMEELIRDSCPDLDSIENVTQKDFRQVVENHLARYPPQEARTWAFGGLERGPDGRFDDRKVAELIKSCIEEPAHEFGAHGTPQSLKIVDIMGQLQARDVFNVCTLNEFRRYLNLKPYEKFEEWNEDTTVARAAELLYGDIDNLELYPGLMAECTKPFRAGSGVCPGQTTGRGILDDAVSLVRGDRFLSYDFNSNTLTHWGAAKLKEHGAGSYGGVLPRLIFNGLPGAFTGTSPYALLPFYTPDAARGILEQNHVLDLYDLSRPPSDREIISIQTYEGCKKALEDRSTFRTIYGTAIRAVPVDGDSRAKSLYELCSEYGSGKNVASFFGDNVQKLIQNNSLSFVKGRKSIDIVRDVTNIAPILWLADRFALPLKTAEQPLGVFTPHEAFFKYHTLFLYHHFNIFPENEFKLRQDATRAAEPLRAVFETHLKSQQGVIEHIVDWLDKGSAFEVGYDADRLYHILQETKMPMDEMVNECINISTPIAGVLAHQASLLIDFYLRKEQKQHKERIVQLAHRTDAASEKELRGFVFEGMRHAAAVRGIPRRTTSDVTIDDGVRGPVSIPAGHTVLIATSQATMDGAAFPEPEKINPHRNFDGYTLFEHGLHCCLTTEFIGASLAATLRAVFKLKNVRRAKKKQGNFAFVEQEVAGVKVRKYLDSNSHEVAIPTSLTLHYDE